MAKLERYGCARPVVGLVIPTGYSFNLDGTSIYLSMATVFLAQVYGVPLTIMQQLGFFAGRMISSKGAPGVTGRGFIGLGGRFGGWRVGRIGGMGRFFGVDGLRREGGGFRTFIGKGSRGGGSRAASASSTRTCALGDHGTRRARMALGTEPTA